jgi:spermidine dehydrogenase
MGKRAVERDDESLGLNNRSVTRRDFIGGALLGSGAALLGMASPGLLRAAEPAGAAGAAGAAARKGAYPLLGPEWTGPGGIGDYSRSNGNTHEVVNAAHSLWKGEWDKPPAGVIDAGAFDLVVVGGGFAGLMAAYTFNKEGKGTCLLLDNHPMFGGEAKQNEMEIDGIRLMAPQGSNGFSWPNSARIWKEIGLPTDFKELQWQRQATGTEKPLRIPDDSYSPMDDDGKEADLGFFFRDASSPGGHKWVRNPWASGFRDAPLPERVKLELMMIQHYQYREPVRKDWEQWLDSMTYKEFLQNVVGVTRKEVFQYLDPLVGATFPALGSDVISAYTGTAFPAASAVWRASQGNRWGEDEDKSIYTSFPGGNSGIARHLAKAILPEAIQGERKLRDVVYGKINWEALDREGNKVRMRLGSTAVRVEHAGPPDSSSAALVTYLNGGKAYRVKAKGVVMAGGQWMNKHVVRDEPDSLTRAMDQFHHGPMLTVNVGVRHWRYMEKLGISCARWFEHEGFGWFTGLRAPMVIDGEQMPLDPGKPTILTFYIPFTYAVSQSGMPLALQALTARNELFSMSYKEIERRIREQLTAMFGDYGFDPKNDIAGLITNRWGHAYVVPQPGFYFGRDGKPAPRDVVRKGYGRVRFGHSELTGFQLWDAACDEGERATKQVLEFV